MEEKELEKFKQKLLTLRENLIKEVNKMEREQLHTTPKDSSGSLSSYSQHMAEVAADSYEMERNIGLVSRETSLLHEVDEALYRIGAGTYGICEVCGGEIDLRRLEAIPYTTLCIECKRRGE
jgi:RNA polymerase-binding protein DksA